jgi:protein-disulfide isomerase
MRLTKTTLRCAAVAMGSFMLAWACSPAPETVARAPREARVEGLSGQFTDEQHAEIRAVVRDYLVNNPDVLEEAFRALEQSRLDEAFAQMTSDERMVSFGPADAPITIVEFFDYQCTFCHQAMNWVFATQRARDDVRVVLIEVPQLSEASYEASQAAIATTRQGKYLPFHRALMNHQGPLDAATIDRIAASAGVDVARMRRDMADPAIATLIQDGHQMAANAGGRGTPFFMINGRAVAGFDQTGLAAALSAATDEVRAARQRT